MTANEAVLFDLDDTLLDSEAAWRSGMDSLLARCRHVERTAAVQAWRAAFSEHYPRYLSGELTCADSRIARSRSWAERLPITVRAGAELAWFDDYSRGLRGAN